MSGLSLNPSRTAQFLISIGLIVLLPWACSKQGDEARLNELLDTAVNAAIGRDSSFLQDVLADDFHSQKVKDKRELLGLLRLYWLRNKKIYVLVSDRRISISGDVATMELILLLGGNQSGGIVPEQGRRLDLLLEWRKVNDKWQVVYASWEQDLQ